MKKIILCLLFLFSCTLFAQNKCISCDSIKNKILDKKIYSKINGKVFFRPDMYENSIYKINLSDTDFYYVSKSLMKRIKKSIKLNSCTGITIEKLMTVKDKNTPKIIRD